MTILCYGDSNTYGAMPMRHLDDQRRFDPKARWPNVMAAALGRPVQAEGLPGRTIAQDDPIEGVHLNGLSVLPAVLLSHTPLECVILKLGTNDTKARFSLTSIDIALSMARMVRQVRLYLPDVPVLVICPPPVVETGCLAQMFEGASARSSGLAPLMQERLGQFENVAFFDAAKVIATDPLEGVHYSADAQVTLGHAVADVLRQAGI